MRSRVFNEKSQIGACISQIAIAMRPTGIAAPIKEFNNGMAIVEETATNSFTSSGMGTYCSTILPMSFNVSIMFSRSSSIVLTGIFGTTALYGDGRGSVTSCSLMMMRMPSMTEILPAESVARICIVIFFSLGRIGSVKEKPPALSAVVVKVRGDSPSTV